MDPRQHQWLSSLIQQFSCYGKYLRCKILCGNGLQCLLVQVSLNDASVKRRRARGIQAHERVKSVRGEEKRTPCAPLALSCAEILHFLLLLNPATETMMMITPAGLSLRAGGRGFSPATKRVAPCYFYWKIVEKENQKKSLAVWFPAYLLYLPGNSKS